MFDPKAFETGDVLKMAPDGFMRLRRLTKNKAVVEVRSPFFAGSWTYAAFRYLPTARAEEMFQNQLRHHQYEPDKYTRPVVQPGV